MTDPPQGDSVPMRPLAAIRDKENALAQAIQLAQEQAQAYVDEARIRANAIEEQAERDSMQETAKLYQDGIARASEQADAIRWEGESVASQLYKSGWAKLAEATEYIVQFALPYLRD